MEAIPHAILGVDILAQSHSGTGKTSLYILSILHQLMDNPKPNSALIIIPYSVLAHNIQPEIARISKYLPGIRSAIVCGGVPI